MNPLRWRTLAIMVGLVVGTFGLAIPLFLNETEKRKTVLIYLGAFLLGMSLIGISVLVALWWRYPVTDEKDTNE